MDSTSREAASHREQLGLLDSGRYSFKKEKCILPTECELHRGRDCRLHNQSLITLCTKSAEP